MQETTPTAQEMLAEILGKPAPKTKTKEIELAYLALMGDENIRPIDKPDIYCAKVKIVNEPTPRFPGGSATSQQTLGYVLAISILNQHPEIPLPDCKSL